MINMPSAQTAQLIFVDALFLSLATCLLLWFRSWLKRQTARIDLRLAGLEEHERALERNTEKLLSACRQIEIRLAEAPPCPPAPAEGGQDMSAVPEPKQSGTGWSAVAWGERLSELRRAADRQTATSAQSGTATKPTSDTGSPRLRPAASGMLETPNRGKREEYRWARKLLEQGIEASEVARKVGLGLAEVEVLKRINDYGDYSS